VLRRKRVASGLCTDPVYAPGKIYLVSENGDTLVLRAGRTPQVLARNKPDMRVIASPAISDGRIFIRGDRHFDCDSSHALACLSDRVCPGELIVECDAETRALRNLNEAFFESLSGKNQIRPPADLAPL
jgi:hypothetical protein